MRVDPTGSKFLPCLWKKKHQSDSGFCGLWKQNDLTFEYISKKLFDNLHATCSNNIIWSLILADCCLWLLRRKNINRGIKEFRGMCLLADVDLAQCFIKLLSDGIQKWGPSTVEAGTRTSYTYMYKVVWCRFHTLHRHVVCLKFTLDWEICSFSCKTACHH